jgi:hypothetical protein
MGWLMKMEASSSHWKELNTSVSSPSHADAGGTQSERPGNRERRDLKLAPKAALGKGQPQAQERLAGLPYFTDRFN